MKKKKINDTTNFKFGLLFGSLAVVLLLVIAITVPAITGNAFWDRFDETKPTLVSADFKLAPSGSADSKLAPIGGGEKSLSASNIIGKSCKEIWISNDNYNIQQWSPLSTGAGDIKGINLGQIEEGATGMSFCQYNGFNSCIGINRQSARTFFFSNDGSCAKGVDFYDSYYMIRDCANPIQQIKGYCATGTYISDDKTRDIKDTHKDISVICCNL